VPSLPAAMFCVLLLFPGSVLAAGYLRQQADLAMEHRLLLSALVSMALFAGLPLGAALLMRVRLSSGFRIHRRGWLAFLAAGIWGLSAWPWLTRSFC
jgi:hypothetical protein